MAIAVVPFASAAKLEQDLYQMMAGAVEVLQAAGCELVGGHSGEGAEMALGEPNLIWQCAATRPWVLQVPLQGQLKVFGLFMCPQTPKTSRAVLGLL